VARDGTERGAPTLEGSREYGVSVSVIEFVVDAFEIVLPVFVFVNFIKYDQRHRWISAFDFLEKSGVLHKADFVTRNIPVEIEII
jgi:hypothetical protein